MSERRPLELVRVAHGAGQTVEVALVVFVHPLHAVPQLSQDAPENPVVVLRTSAGVIHLELFEDQAPNTVANFIELTEDGFYDGIEIEDEVRTVLDAVPDDEAAILEDAWLGRRVITPRSKTLISPGPAAATSTVIWS